MAVLTPLHQQVFSLAHSELAATLANTENLLIVQDLDGVCMGLVNDPLTRQMDPRYVEAIRGFDGHFFVLTNGEHIGQRGVNRLIEQAFPGQDCTADQLYLPGLAAGGVQWQERSGELQHPGVSETELNFLATVPEKMAALLQAFLSARGWQAEEIASAQQASVLNNKVSPTFNLNILHHRLNSPEIYLELQSAIAKLIQDLLQAAKNQGLGNSFFVHYAPNLGRDEEGLEILRPATANDSGTTDFQFMLRGGIKEAGLVALLNRYYFLRTGQYPLGAEFNARQAPHTHEKLLQLVEQNFDPAEMPCIVGVGDTVTSKAVVENGQQTFRRGGSDRNFLQLIQDLNSVFGTGNLVVYVDSSGGELKNRRALGLNAAQDQVLTGPCDLADQSDPLKLNIVFPGGHQQYIQTFTAAAHQRKG